MRISDWSADVCSSDLQLGVDGAAGTRHQHPAASDEPLHGGTVEWCLRPAEQILDSDRADLQALLHAAAEVGQPRQAGYRGAVAVGQLQHVIKFVALQRLGQDYPLRLALSRGQPAEHLRQILELPEHPHAVNVPADAGALLVDGAKHLEGAVVVARHPARSEEHTSELQSLMRTSYACFP